jgi:predicted AAA+ superfamily ATPase
VLDLQQLLPPFNPWWADPHKAFEELQSFHRPIFDDLKEGIGSLKQIISVTGPRRIGKTTLLHQLIADLVARGVNPRRILYYSLDDPALLLHTPEEIHHVIETMMQLTNASEEPWFFFLDEIQRLEGWELYLKKYYDLDYPVRFIVSGSASSPIFKKNRESLLGRVKQYHLLPFSFREFALFRSQGLDAAREELLEIRSHAESVFQSMLAPSRTARKGVNVARPSQALMAHVDAWLATYVHEGGFPEVWNLPTLVAKQDYLFDNQVRKVIDEDLVLAVELRKPELLKRFYLSLLAIPGAEKNIQSIAKETGIHTAQIEKYLPLLEMTDLLFHVSKFRAGSLTVRKGNVKFYVCDLALRNAILRISPEALMADDDTLGRYAENLVFLALKQLRGTLQIDFYRERDDEIDFIVHSGAGRYLPVEVKYRNSISERDGNLLRKFSAEYPCHPIMVTKTWDQFGTQNGIFRWPLPLFLIMFG